MSESTIVPAVLTAREAARYLGYSYTYFKDHVQYDLPYIQRVPSGRITFRRQDLDKWIEKNLVRPPKGAS